jgi:pimeloyl-ACP methyl ester carboxylesterase
MGAGFAGSRTLTITDERLGVAFPTWVLYPTEVPARAVRFGPYAAEVSPEAPPSPSRGAVVISHGSGGSPLLYRVLAVHLARHGYTVALPEHAGNHRGDNTLAESPENLARRPRHVSLVLDAMDAGRAAVIGHSMGAYTALAAAGGQPRDAAGQPVEVVADARVAALVLLAPVAYWYVMPGSLARVTAPVLLYRGTEDRTAPAWHAQLVQDEVARPDQVRCRAIEGAGHYSFLSPFPPELRRPDFPPSVDPQGFDRERLHEAMNTEILEFLGQTL